MHERIRTNQYAKIYYDPNPIIALSSNQEYHIALSIEPIVLKPCFKGRSRSESAPPKAQTGSLTFDMSEPSLSSGYRTATIRPELSFSSAVSGLTTFNASDSVYQYSSRDPKIRAREATTPKSLPDRIDPRRISTVVETADDTVEEESKSSSRTIFTFDDSK
jgi:hypothetical protein